MATFSRRLRPTFTVFFECVFKTRFPFTALAFIILNSYVAYAPDTHISAVCGSCSKLQNKVKDLSAEQITDYADRTQARGDKRLASQAMCGGICSGKLLIDGGSFSNLGVLFREQNLFLSAATCYRVAIRLEPMVAGHRYRMCV